MFINYLGRRVEVEPNIVIDVEYQKINETEYLDDEGQTQTIQSRLISEDGTGWYCVSQSTKILGSGL